MPDDTPNMADTAADEAKKNADAKAVQDDLRASLDQTTGAITDQTRALVATQAEADGLIEKARQIGVSNGTLTDAILGDPDAIRAQIRDRFEVWVREATE